MRNIVVIITALWLSGCVTFPQRISTLPPQEDPVQTKMPKKQTPIKITTAQEAEENQQAHATEKLYRQTDEKPEVKSAPIDKVEVTEISDHKRDVMSLDYINKKKTKFPENTNIYKPLMGYLGGHSNDILSLLGTPTRERNDPKVRVWQYKYMLRGLACWVDVYLYPKGGKYQAQYIELRGIKMSEYTRRKCFASKYRTD